MSTDLSGDRHVSLFLSGIVEVTNLEEHVVGYRVQHMTRKLRRIMSRSFSLSNKNISVEHEEMIIRHFQQTHRPLNFILATSRMTIASKTIFLMDGRTGGRTDQVMESRN